MYTDAHGYDKAEERIICINRSFLNQTDPKLLPCKLKTISDLPVLVNMIVLPRSDCVVVRTRTDHLAVP
jgi:hypothetical protein